jgi:hypothetical protein
MILMNNSCMYCMCLFSELGIIRFRFGSEPKQGVARDHRGSVREL